VRSYTKGELIPRERPAAAAQAPLRGAGTAAR